MPIPVKALRFSQLTKAGTVVPTSGHEVSKVQWLEHDRLIDGFFKKIDLTYPVLLAKYTVAVTVAMRCSLGALVAEDRLVFDAHDQIIGTVSVTLPGFVPLLSLFETSDTREKHLVTPSKDDLIKFNVSRLLAALWRWKEDDAHPGNFSLLGVIDGDMRLRDRTAPMKGYRLIDGNNLKETMRLKKTDLDNFPNIKGRTHWPTHWVPANGNVGKQFQSYEAFQSLAANVSCETEAGQTSFYQQYFESLLFELLTYDPEMLKSRLQEYLGELPLDYQSLEKENRDDLVRQYPELFYESVDRQSFVEHILKVFQQEYNEFYRTVVFYTGCDRNIKNTRVLSFVDFIKTYPSAFKKVQQWTNEQNAHAEFSSASQFDFTKMAQRYYQIWRDAHILSWEKIWQDLNSLAGEIAKTLGVLCSPITIDQSILLEGEKLTDVGQYVDIVVDKTVGELSESGMDDGMKRLALLHQFIEQFGALSKTYFKTQRTEKLFEANQEYCRQLLCMLDRYQKSLFLELMPAEWKGRFTELAQNIYAFYGGLQLSLHLFSRDNALGLATPYDYSAIVQRPHTDDKVVMAFLQAFFKWLNEIPREELIRLIEDVVTNDYTAPAVKTNVINFYNPLAYRVRAPEVLSALEQFSVLQEVKGAEILAYILSTGGAEITSLNTLIIKRLLPLMIRGTMGPGGVVDVNLMSLETALGRNDVAFDFYTQKVTEYVRRAPQFKDEYSHLPLSQNLFYDAMYRWVDKSSSFVALVNEAIKQYKPSSVAEESTMVASTSSTSSQSSYLTSTFSFFGSVVSTVSSSVSSGITKLKDLNRTRDLEVSEYLANKTLSNACILGQIFQKGAFNDAWMGGSASLNVILFGLIFDAMKQDLETNQEKCTNDAGFALVLRMDPLKAKEFLKYDSFRVAAKERAKMPEESEIQLDSVVVVS